MQLAGAGVLRAHHTDEHGAGRLVLTGFGPLAGSVLAAKVLSPRDTGLQIDVPPPEAAPAHVRAVKGHFSEECRRVLGTSRSFCFPCACTRPGHLAPSGTAEFASRGVGTGSPSTAMEKRGPVTEMARGLKPWGPRWSRTAIPVRLIDSPRGELSLSGTPFAAGGEFTVGSEEELLLVDTDDRLKDARSGELIEAVQAGSFAAGTVTKELFGAEIEFATAVCQNADEVGICLAEFRASLCRAGGRAMAVGLHPAGEFGNAMLTVSPRYEAIGASLAGLLRTPTAALQVQVGMPDAATAITAYRGLRHRLALLRALAAGSPYWHGLDSGFATGRWAVINSYPRGGVPPVVHSWEEYVALNEAVAAAAEVPDYTYVWWDVRLQPRLGTIEVRVMDAQSSLRAAVGLTALIQALARYAVDRPLAVDVPSDVLAENDFRAARDGLDARIVDIDGTMRPVRELAAAALGEARAVLASDGLEGPLEAIDQILTDEPEYTRQRRIHYERGMAGLLADLTARTMRAR